MNILAIDHGTRLMGFSFIEKGHPTAYGVYPMQSSYPQTMIELLQVVGGLIRHYAPQALATERPMSLRNGNIAQKLIEHYAMCKTAALMKNIPILEVAPPTLKLIVTGAGNADKQTVAESLCIQYGLDLDALCPAEYYKAGAKKGTVKSRLWDAADAVALGIAAYEIQRRGEASSGGPQTVS